MNDPAAVEAEKLDDAAVDSELSMAILHYDPNDKYPEWPNSSMREAYRAGFEDGARELLKPIRDELDALAYVTKPPCDFGTLLDAYEKAIDQISRHCFTSEELKA
jgi:hypothetical protein